MTERDFIDALAGSECPLIGEVKLTTPAGRPLAPGRTPADLVERYHDLGVPCLSVVTGRWFGGTQDLLSEVRRLTDLPVLRKDFITRRADVERSAGLGADAVLLTAALLPGEALNDLAEYALGLDLTPFVEVCSHDELDLIADAGRCVVAVNNRDIRAQERTGAGIGRSLAMIEAVTASGTRCPTSASGIADPSAAQSLLDAGYRALLVGSSLMAEPDLQRWQGLRRAPWLEPALR